MKLIQILAFSLIMFVTSFAAMAGPVDINTANAYVISKTLKGIGLKKAKAIVAYREKNGKFKKIDDLAKVKGIGKKTIAMNKENLRIGTEKK